MTGCPDHNRPAFDAAAKRLREQGHFVINPHDFTPLFGSEEEIANSFRSLYAVEDLRYSIANYNISQRRQHDLDLAESMMDSDLAAVRSCDAIYLLRGWETSRGAKRELAEAIAHGLTVMQEEDEK
jgi:hypothetical protein